MMMKMMMMMLTGDSCCCCCGWDSYKYPSFSSRNTSDMYVDQIKIALHSLFSRFVQFLAVRIKLGFVFLDVYIRDRGFSLCSVLLTTTNHHLNVIRQYPVSRHDTRPIQSSLNSAIFEIKNPTYVSRIDSCKFDRLAPCRLCAWIRDQSRQWELLMLEYIVGLCSALCRNIGRVEMEGGREEGREFGTDGFKEASREREREIQEGEGKERKREKLVFVLNFCSKWEREG